MIKKVFMIAACWINFNVNGMFSAFTNPLKVLCLPEENKNKITVGGFNRLKTLQARMEILKENKIFYRGYKFELLIN
jgi:hypothetical protein